MCPSSYLKYLCQCVPVRYLCNGKMFLIFQKLDPDPAQKACFRVAPHTEPTEKVMVFHPQDWAWALVPLT